MPVLPVPVGNPYPTIGSVMNVARARVLDMINDINGDLLTTQNPASQVYLSAAWRWLQGQCATAGVETFIREIILSGLPQRFVEDTANQAWVTWLGCSDGYSQYEQPRLPQDLIIPLSVWRRQAGTTNGFGIPMTQAEDGLPTHFDLNVYDWREDGLYFYANTYAQDLKIRYSAFRPDLDITQPNNNVPMMMCEDCLGARVGFEYANARGSVQAASLKTWADDAFDVIAQRTSRRKQRQTIRRVPYSGRSCQVW